MKLLAALLLTSSLGLALAMPADAAVALHSRFATATANCQAFTPGISNTIRNRVIGAENVGSAPIAIACSFPTFANGAAGNTPPRSLRVFFENTTSANMTINCTLLVGGGNGLSSGTQYAVSRSVVVPANFIEQMDFGSADNPNTGATDFGDQFVGLNCVLPPGGMMKSTRLQWNADNGV